MQRRCIDLDCLSLILYLELVSPFLYRKITDKSTICLAVNAFLSLKENDELEDGKTRMLHKEWRSCGAAIYGDAKQCYVVQIFSTGGGNGLIIDIMKAQKRT